MLDTLVAKNPALLIPMLAILSAGVVFVVWVVSHYYFAIRQLEAERSLKQDMLAREFTAADIERVMLASKGTEPGPSAEKVTISDNEYYLVEKMLDEEYPIEEIERLVRAFKEGKKVVLPKEHVQA